MVRRADLKTGYDCNSNCLFCVIGDKLFSGDRSTEDCLAELERSRATCDDVVFTGAEVTIREDFFVLVRAAKQLGYRNIQIQTNGRMMAYSDFCERTIAAGANEFSPSIHGPTAKVHDALTRSRGSFDQIVAAIKNLKRLGQRVVTNTVIAKQNAQHLGALATMLVELGVDQFQLAFPHPTGHAATYFEQVVPRVSEVRAGVHEALRIGIDAGVDCMAEAMPFCQMEGVERQVSELHIPPTEIVYDGYVVPDYGEDRMQRGKVRFEQCASCRFEPICEGPWREYPERMGSDEFVPVEGPRVVDPAVVLYDQLRLLGTEIELSPRFASAPSRSRWTLIVIYPEAGSPACTAQLCGLEDESQALCEAGVTVVALSPDSAADRDAFRARHHLGFVLGSSADASLASRLGYGRGGGVQRVSYLLDAQGRVAHVFPEVDVARHTAQVLAAIERLDAPPRPIGPAPDLVTIRRGPEPEGALR